MFTNSLTKLELIGNFLLWNGLLWLILEHQLLDLRILFIFSLTHFLKHVVSLRAIDLLYLVF